MRESPPEMAEATDRTRGQRARHRSCSYALPMILPDGFRYAPEFIPVSDELALLEHIGCVEFAAFEMRGVVAKRRVAFFGRSYERTQLSPPIPAFLLAVRDRLAAWAEVDASAFEMALINEYPPGAPIGWHRDAPQYEIVAGLSLLSACRMRFRPYVSPAAMASRPARRVATHEVELEPRSAYLMTGEARHSFEHHIPAVDALRYSITFRTLRASRPKPGGGMR
jgi:alkylated DNA repair dioxygenase AlkB